MKRARTSLPSWARGAALATLLLSPSCGRDDGGSPQAGTPPSTPPRPDASPYASDGRLVGGGAPPSLRRRNVLLICLDTVRADSLAPYPGSRDLMPGLAAWCKKAVVFRQASSAAPWTAPSIASLMTGLLPSHHGARELSHGLVLVPAVATLAEVLGAQGWSSASYTGGGWVGDRSGILQGIGRPRSPFSFAGMGKALLGVHEGLSGVGPWLLVLHTYEAHEPYLGPPAQAGAPAPSSPALDREAIDRAAAADGGRTLARYFLLDAPAHAVLFEGADAGPRTAVLQRYLDGGVASDPEGPAFSAEARAAYEEGVRRLDKALATYLAEAESHHLLDDAIVVVTADHGEAFGEHGMLHHGRRLYEELVRVPLAIRAPGWPEGLVVDEPASLLDVMATVLDLVGLPAPGGDGRSLVPLVAGGGRGRPCPAQEHRTETETGTPGEAALASVRDGKRKWILVREIPSGRETEEAYDLEADPLEKHALPAAALASWPAEFREAVEKARAAAR